MVSWVGIGRLSVVWPAVRCVGGDEVTSRRGAPAPAVGSHGGGCGASSTDLVTGLSAFILWQVRWLPYVHTLPIS